MGGAGDAGRDIEARLTETLLEDQWDLYQAKHYRDALPPTQFFPELAKFFGHLLKNTYPPPRRYLLCAPANAGPDLHDLFANPAQFKARFLADWAAGKTGLKPKQLKPALHNLVEAYDFSRIDECLARDLIELHRLDPTEHFKLFHVRPERGVDPVPPKTPVRMEEVYIAELVRLYSEEKGGPLTLAEILESDAFAQHFESCRSEFYCAEGLKRFSRDIFPEEFGRLLKMIYDGIRSTIHSPRHKTGFARMDAVHMALPGVPLMDSKLHSSMRGGDLKGTCHHLVNEKAFTWVK